VFSGFKFNRLVRTPVNYLVSVRVRVRACQPVLNADRRAIVRVGVVVTVRVRSKCY
jgi:hypothetical protein